MDKITFQVIFIIVLKDHQTKLQHYIYAYLTTKFSRIQHVTVHVNSTVGKIRTKSFLEHITIHSVFKSIQKLFQDYALYVRMLKKGFLNIIYIQNAHYTVCYYDVDIS